MEVTYGFQDNTVKNKRTEGRPALRKTSVLELSRVLPVLSVFVVFLFGGGESAKVHGLGFPGPMDRWPRLHCRFNTSRSQNLPDSRGEKKTAASANQ